MTTYQVLLSQLGKFSPLVPSEATEDYLKRIVAAVSALSVEGFEQMPVEARQWFDEAMDALSSGMRVPIPEGFDRDLALAPAKGPIRIARPSGSAVSEHDVGPPIAPRLGAAAAMSTEPLNQVVVKLLVMQPDMTLDDLMHKLAERHIDAPRNSVAAVRSSTLTVMRLLTHDRQNG